MAWTPSIVPSDEDTVYLVLDDPGGSGRVYREAMPEQADIETLIEDLISGQYSNPVRIVAFNVAEGWARDVSQEVAQEIQMRADVQLHDVPDVLVPFVDRYARREQLSLRLVRR